MGALQQRDPQMGGTMRGRRALAWMLVSTMVSILQMPSALPCLSATAAVLGRSSWRRFCGRLGCRVIVKRKECASPVEPPVFATSKTERGSRRGAQYDGSMWER